ncbi:hypothetical protein, partial [Acidithiobacillus sp.]|uniref:hypothetical protein n=1 Tax=Acidithiobacillus sp. TaxID=1872118 RepID=UPI003CFF711D
MFINANTLTDTYTTNQTQPTHSPSRPQDPNSIRNIHLASKDTSSTFESSSEPINETRSLPSHQSTQINHHHTQTPTQARKPKSKSRYSNHHSPHSNTLADAKY